MKTTDEPRSYLRARELRIGDILLTGSKRVGAKRLATLGIQVATVSRWTHAGIVATRTGVLQATSFGDFAIIASLPVVRATDGEPLLEVRAEQVRILRPTTGTLSGWRPRSSARPGFGDEIAAQVLAYLGRDYATQNRMAQYVPRLFRPFAKILMAKLSGDSRAGMVLKGLCCSELVDLAYRDAGLSITDARTKLVSPATISRSSRLREITRAVRMVPSLTPSLPSHFPLEYVQGYLSSEIIDRAVSDATALYSDGSDQNAVKNLDGHLTDCMQRAAADLLQLYDYERNLVNAGLL